jgi:signal-transduction protein with cAMP-binding, CBS, and nucleotidyltransferase domain
MEQSLNDYLRTNFKDRLRAKDPVNLEVFLHLPHFPDVFGNDERLFQALSTLSSPDGAAYLKLRVLKPGEMVIKKGEYGNCIYWLIEGQMEVVKILGGKPVIVARYKDVGQCFGELSTINNTPRTADVRATNSGATLLEVNWSITSVCRELDANFHKFLSKAACEKLDDSYKAFDLTLEIIRESKGFDNRLKTERNPNPEFPDRSRE